MSELRELEKAIIADPEDRAAHSVYADALQEAGDPRGEHIALALAANSGDTHAANRIIDLQTKGSRQLAKLLPRLVVRVDWRFGLVERLRLEARSGTDRMVDEGGLRELLGQPPLFALRELDLRAVQMLGGFEEIAPRLLGELPVRWIGFPPFASQSVRSVIRSLEQLFEKLPHFAGIGIALASAQPVLEALRDQPRLRGLDLTTTVERIDTLADHLLVLAPKLERLVLHDVESEAMLAPVLAGSVYPELRQLGVLCNAEPSGRLVRALVTSPLLPRLTALGLRTGQLYDDESTRKFMVDNAKAFAHVRLFTSSTQPGGFDVGRLGWLYNKLDRPREGYVELAHHLDHCGGKGEHAVCHAELGAALFSAGAYETALGPIDRAIAAYGDAPAPPLVGNAAYSWRLRVHCLDRLKRHDEELLACDRAIALEPNNTWTLQFQAASWRELGRNTDALGALERAIEICNTLAEQRHRLGWAMVMRGNLLFGMRRFGDAVTALTEVLANDDAAAVLEAQENLGAMARHRGNLAEAQHWYEQATKRAKPNHAKAIDNLALVLFERGELEAALATWKRAAAEYPTWNDIDEQGHVLIALGRPDEALATLAGGLEIGGARACALHALGRTEEAFAPLDDYAVRDRLTDATCVYRHVAGNLLQGLLHRAAGREGDAKRLLARARAKPETPREVHAAIARRIRPRNCPVNTCGRRAAVVAVIAALAAGKRDEAISRARKLAAAVAAALAYGTQLRMWEAHAAVAFLEGSDAELGRACLRLVERCGGDLPI